MKSILSSIVPLVAIVALNVPVAARPNIFRERLSADAFVEKYGTLLAEDQVYYRWQSTVSGENLVKAGGLNAVTNRHFMTLTDEIAAGPGLYLAGTELSSERYMPHSGGNLIEARIAKGTRVLDLTDAAVVAAMEKSGLTNKQFFANPERTVVLKYSADWYVGKNLTDRVSFRMYPGPQHSAEAVGKILVDAAASTQIADQVRQHRPDLAAGLARSGQFSPVLARLLPDAELPALLETTLKRPELKDSRHVDAIDRHRFATDRRRHRGPAPGRTRRPSLRGPARPASRSVRI